MPVRPAHGSLVLQTPPAFTWPVLAAGGNHQFRLTGPDGLVLERDSARNHLLLDRTLPPGRYNWQLRMPTGGDPDADWSDPRTFEILPDAAPFPIPDIGVLWERATTAPHPRQLPAGAAGAAHRDALLDGQRKALFTRLHDAVAARAGARFRPPPGRGTGAKLDPRPGLWPAADEQPYRDELSAMENAAMVWHVAGDPAALADARHRLDGVLDWPTDGPTAFARNDQLALRLLWALAVTYDLLQAQLPPAERNALLQAVSERAGPAFRWHFDNPESPTLNLNSAPFDSHGYLHLANFAALAVIFAGILPQAEDWFSTAVPLFLALGHPWGGDDGGSGNGANYAFYYLIDLLPRWDVLRNGIGIDPAHSAWARNFPVYASYFVPPGMPFVFGDGAGHADVLLKATVARGLAARTGDRIARRYSAHLPRSHDVPPLLELTAPIQMPALPGGPDHGTLPDAAILASIGWAALHSRLWARSKASVYFRSGPFGSESHNHGDQNSFSIDIDGRRVAIDSGYYDSYGSRHRLNWTRQTRAHNAITFDGGRGQAVPRHDADGRITSFADDGRLAVVSGDATAAYDGALTGAVRTLAFLRPDIVLVYDRLDSTMPRRFEWNLHGQEPLRPLPGGKSGRALAIGDGLLCLEMLAPTRLDLTLSDRFGNPADAPERDDLPAQFHARYAMPRPVAASEFLAILRLRCAPAAVSDLYRKPDGGFELTLESDRRIVIDAAGARLLAVQSGPD